jgi:hypothetical protein
MKDLTWYIKWLATFVLIAGTFVNALGYYPLGPMILALGGVLWTVVALQWRDNALITTNVILSLVGILGLAHHYYLAG